jgi:glutathione S-transferase
MSPFVRKIWAMAAEMEVPIELRAAGFGQGGAEFQEASPFGKMPGFRDPGADDGRDFVISDSTAIAAYLDAKYPGAAMIPVAPIARARTIWFEEFSDTIIMKAGIAIFFNRFVSPKILKRPGNEAAAEAAERDELPQIFDYIESVVPPSGFLVEERLTLADLSVASPFANLRHLGVAFDRERWPKACGYIDAILARPSFAGTIAREAAAMARM